MSNISQWSTSAASNNSASPNGAPEGMAPSGVNDTMRENMAAIARQFQDSDGSLTTAGTGNAYTLTTNNNNAALADQGLIVFRADRANTGSATLNVDSLGAKNIEAGGEVLASGDIVANSIYAVAYNSTNDTYDILNAQAIGTAVQAWDAGLDDISGLAVTNSNFIVGDGANWVAESGATARASLGVTIGTDVQAQSAALDDLDAVGVVSAADNFLVSTGAGTWSYETTAQVRTTLGLVIGTNVQAWDAHLDDLGALAAVSGADQFMVSSGAGTWAYETTSQVRTTLGLVIGTNVQAWDAHLDDLAALSTASGADQIMVSTGAGTWALESGATARASLGVNSATDAAEGLIELATQTEVNTGTDTTRAVTPSTLANWTGGAPASETKYLTTSPSNNTTTQTDITGFTGFAFDADSYYKLEGYFEIAANEDVDLQWVFTNTPQNSGWGIHGHRNDGTHAGFYNVMTSATDPGQATAARYAYHVSGFVRTNATTGGTADLQFARPAGATTGVQMFQGAWLKFTKLS